LLLPQHGAEEQIDKCIYRGESQILQIICQRGAALITRFQTENQSKCPFIYVGNSKQIINLEKLVPLLLHNKRLCDLPQGKNEALCQMGDKRKEGKCYPNFRLIPPAFFCIYLIVNMFIGFFYFVYVTCTNYIFLAFGLNR